jgi:hypothetical protein
MNTPGSRDHWWWIRQGVEITGDEYTGESTLPREARPMGEFNTKKVVFLDVFYQLPVDEYKGESVASHFHIHV